jgi:hypothetical protein
MSDQRVRAAILAFVASGAMTLLYLVDPPPAYAECTQLSPWPSFREAAPSARTILIGTVTWTPGGRINNRFTLRVDEVLRGSAPSEIEIDRLHSGAPEPNCPGESSLKVRRWGERLAIAYDAHLRGLRRPITAVAFVRPSRPSPFFLPGMERLSARDVREIAAAIPETDTALPAHGAPEMVAQVQAVLPWAAGAVSFVLGLAAINRRRRPVLQAPHGGSKRDSATSLTGGRDAKTPCGRDHSAACGVRPGGQLGDAGDGCRRRS